MMEFFVIFFLILLNGLFALSEIAIISARKSKLKDLAEKGSQNAKYALDLANEPNRLLSTIQVGITFIGIFAGAFGGGRLTEYIANPLRNVPGLGLYADTIALIVIVGCITYLSLVIGELVPKRVALSNAEGIALLVARPMYILSSIFSPIITILSSSVEKTLNLLGIRPGEESTVTDEEVTLLMLEGEKHGTFDEAERDIVERTFKMSDRKANSLMIPRKEIVWVKSSITYPEFKKVIAKTPFSYFPICKEDLDSVIGIVRTEEILVHSLREQHIDIDKFLLQPLYIPESTDGLAILEQFKKTGIHVGLVVDEYGSIQGLLSLTDILEAIVGDIPSEQEKDHHITRRDDNTFLVDGIVSIEEFKDYFHLKALSNEKTALFQTIGGFVIYHIEKIPVAGDVIDKNGLRFEVIDMDGNRIDKLLVSRHS